MDITVTDRVEMIDTLGQLRPGDCIHVAALSDAAEGAPELLELLETLEKKGAHLVCGPAGLDTRTESGARIAAFCAQLLALERGRGKKARLEGVERPRGESGSKGRRPIEVDGQEFESVTALWRAGQITAREAMSRLKLKPNTFYRRIKQLEDEKMKDYRKIEKEVRSEVKEITQKSRQDLETLKKQVRAETREIKKAAGDKTDAHGVEREIRKERRRAEAERQSEIRRMRKDVASEKKALKKLREGE